jgi:hypothetical protein
MKRLMLLSSAILLSATMSLSAMTADDLIAAYQAKGYTRIEVKTGLTQIKVEAVKGSVKVEVIYDAATGAILKQESERASRDERGTGVEISSEDGDFLDDDDSNDDSDDDLNDDEDDDRDDAIDDRDDDRDDRADDREDRKDDRDDDRDDEDDRDGDDD